MKFRFSIVNLINKHLRLKNPPPPRPPQHIFLALIKKVLIEFTKPKVSLIYIFYYIRVLKLKVHIFVHQKS